MSVLEQAVDPAPFDVCGDLPAGTTVLEASAGTGKTTTIAGLATRYVAEGVDLASVMLVTFSRAATQELRERVRTSLVDAERALGDPPAARTGRDDLLRLLSEGGPDDVERRRLRLRRALSDVDVATITTTHGFCQQMLAGLGMAGDSDPDATFVESTDDLVEEVVDDLFLRKYAPAGAAPPAMTHATARKVARDAMQDHQARLLPIDAPRGTEAQERQGIAEAVRREVDARKRAGRLLDYDDLLTRLRDALRDPVRGPAAQARIRARYSVVLVDEFQDTDPVQWEILRTAFHGHQTLVLVGDPKQAVYAFRGADLVTYLAAAREATTRRSLHRNHRSDAGVVAAVDAVFGGAALGDPQILVRPIKATHLEPRVRGTDSDAALRLRVVRRPAGSWKYAAVGEVRKQVARDLADDVVTLLGGHAVRRADDADEERPVSCGDVAVLVRTNSQAVLVRDALLRADVPAVLTGSGSVFRTAPATEWLVLLRALEQPHRAGLARTAALTCFVGWTAEELDARGERALDELGDRLRRWRGVLTRRGVAALLQLVTATEDLQVRLLARPSGERDLTDLRHVGQALHTAATRESLGPAALGQWLARRIAEAEQDTVDERSRRLESDADTVQVLTIHSAKGLQFPVVYVPYGWNHRNARSRPPDPLRFHGPDGERLLDVGGGGSPGWSQRRAAHDVEEAGEELRLLYVALTRARSRLVVWWAPSANTETSALHRLLLGERDVVGEPPLSVKLPTDDSARRRFEQWARDCPHVSVEPVGAPRDLRWSPPVRRAGDLAAATFDRALDGAWRRTSYSSLTASLHAAGPPPEVGSEPEVPERDDEPSQPTGAADEAPAGTGQPGAELASPLAAFPRGTSFGTLVHSVLERVDTGAADLDAELLRATTEAVIRRGAGVDPAALAAGLRPVLDTRLGPLVDGRRLRDLLPTDRLAELDFELPLAGGDDPAAVGARLPDLAAAVRRHLPPTDPLRGVADLLDGDLAGEDVLRGYLTGSIDAVLRVRPAGGGEPRFVVVDYKTNWLGPLESLTAHDYRPEALTASMLTSGYPLQALLYAVALHRYLRWRLPGYDPERHLGGVLYLYLRGMCGPATPEVDGVPYGVVSWSPPAALVEELSALLDGGAQ